MLGDKIKNAKFSGICESNEPEINNISDIKESTDTNVKPNVKIDSVDKPNVSIPIPQTTLQIDYDLITQNLRIILDNEINTIANNIRNSILNTYKEIELKKSPYKAVLIFNNTIRYTFNYSDLCELNNAVMLVLPKNNFQIDITSQSKVDLEYYSIAEGKVKKLTSAIMPLPLICLHDSEMAFILICSN